MGARLFLVSVAGLGGQLMARGHARRSLPLASCIHASYARYLWKLLLLYTGFGYRVPLGTADFICAAQRLANRS